MHVKLTLKRVAAASPLPRTANVSQFVVRGSGQTNVESKVVVPAGSGESSNSNNLKRESVDQLCCQRGLLQPFLL